jgi:hypothetical protein
LRTLCALDEAGERTLEIAVRRMGLSARAHDRVLKVARTIPDLDSAERVSAKHLAEAVQYRWKSGLGRGLGDPSHEMVGSVPLLYSRGSVSRLART